MRTEIDAIIFRSKLVAVKPPSRALASRRAQTIPTHLQIRDIKVEGLPDADKGVGGGGSDPYCRFTIETNLETGNINTGTKFHVRTQTLFNVPRTVVFPEVLEIELPDHVGRGLVSGFCKARVRASIWDDDSTEDGAEGVNADDCVGELTTPMTPGLMGHVDRKTMKGNAELYAFLFSFRFCGIRKETEKVEEAGMSLRDMGSL